MDTAYLREILDDMQATCHNTCKHFSCQNSTWRNNLYSASIGLGTLLYGHENVLFEVESKYLVCRLAA
jgi:hypothetical protein